MRAGGSHDDEDDQTDLGRRPVGPAGPARAHPAPFDYLPPNRFNPDGYFENLKIVDLNDEILQAAEGSVLHPPHREFFAESERYSVYTDRLASVLWWLGQGRSLFGIKDPRLALTLPLYRKAWSTVVPVIAFRNPLSAASSIAEQTGLAFTAALDLWYEYYYRILLYTTGLPRYVLSFERLLEAPAEVALGLARHLGVERSPEEIGARIEGIVDPRKVHHGSQVELPEFSPYLDAKAKLLYRCLHEPARQGRQPDFTHLGSCRDPRETGTTPSFPSRPVDEPPFRARCFVTRPQQAIKRAAGRG